MPMSETRQGSSRTGWKDLRGTVFLTQTERRVESCHDRLSLVSYSYESYLFERLFVLGTGVPRRSGPVKQISGSGSCVIYS